MTSGGVTFHYLTSKFLILIKDCNVGKFHITFTQRCCRLYKNVSQTPIHAAKLLLIILTALPMLGYSETLLI